MSGSFEQWRDNEDAWLDANRDFLNAVLLWFMNHKEWPKVRILQHDIHKSGDRATNVQQIANDMPVIPVWTSPTNRDSIILGARHIIGNPFAHNLLQVIVTATQMAVGAYLSGTPGQQISVRSADLGLTWPGHINVLSLVPNFISWDHPTPFSGSASGNGDWSLGINDSHIMRFEKVKSPEEYVATQLEIIQEWCADLDRRAGAAKHSGQLKAFIVMPLGESWSNLIHGFVRQSVERVGEDIIAVRADEIADPGRITNQIVEQLHNCDFVIADITGNNPNVAWELGYAHAHNKPCVIMRQEGSTELQPFDIYDHRRIEYSVEPTSDQEKQLAEFIRAAIQQTRNRSS